MDESGFGKGPFCSSLYTGLIIKIRNVLIFQFHLYSKSKGKGRIFPVLN